MAYRAEIEIGVKGASRLKELQDRIKKLSNAIDEVRVKDAIDFKATQSLTEYNKALSDANKNLNQVQIQLDKNGKAIGNYRDAINQYVTALGKSNQAQEITNSLLREEISLRENVARAAKLQAAGIKEVTQFSGPIGPGQASQTALSSPLPPSSRLRGFTQFEAPIGPGPVSQTALSSPLPPRSRLRGFTQYEAPIGPGPVSQTALFSRLPPRSALLSGQSSPTGGLVERNLKIKKDELELEKALLKLKERRADTVFEELKYTESLIKGAKEVERVLQRQKGLSQYSTPVPIPGAATKRTQLQSERLAADLTAKSVERLAIEQRLKTTASGVVTQTKLNLALVEKLGPAYKAITSELNRQLSIQKQGAKLAGQFSPIEGTETTPGSPAFLRARSRRRRDAASNALIGGAFPLLFGQGAGAALGGGLGGGLGGLAGGQFGFGLSLVGTTAGQAIDTLIAKAADLGKALDKTSLDIEAVTKAAGEVSKQAQTLIEETKEVAGAEEAAAAAASLLATQIGQDGVTALRNFADANKELDASVAVLISNLSVLGATLLGPVVKGVAGLVERANLAQQVQTIRQEGGPDAERLRAAFERGAAEGGTVDAGNLAQQQEAAAIIAERRQEILDKVEQTNLENSKALPIAEKEGEMLKLKGGLLNENIYLKKKEIIELEYEGKLNQENLTPLQEKILKQEKSNALQKLSNDRAAEAARAAEKANRAEEKAQRQRKQRENQLLSAQAAEKAAANSLMRVDLQKTKVFDGDLAALRQRETQLREELNNNLKILEVRQKQRVQNVKSLEEAKVLHEAYLLQYRALVSQEETETAIVGLAIKRLELSRQQEKIDADRARRSQIEGIRQESFGFTAQLADPFNLNPERVIAAESELRASQLLRAEREKLADLERERTIITPFASTEALDTLKDQIDAQKAFIPQLEAELALRNQLELAAARQSVIIEKYGFLANELSTAMTSAVQAVVTGTSTVEEAFSTMFANIGKAFIDMATQMLAQKLFMTVLGALSGGGAATGINPSGAFNIGLAAGRASGGPVSPGSTYLVGERGPELLTMGPSGGYVTSNSASQAAMDRYSSGNARGGSISVNYNVTDINGMRFVTEDQFREGVAQAAKQGADGGFNRTMSSLKNNRSTRSRVGI